MACAGGAKAEATASGAFPLGAMTVDVMGWFSAGAASPCAGVASCPLIAPWSCAGWPWVASGGVAPASGAAAALCPLRRAGMRIDPARRRIVVVRRPAGCAAAESSSPETQIAVRRVVMVVFILIPVLFVA